MAFRRRRRFGRRRFGRRRFGKRRGRMSRPLRVGLRM